MKTCTPEDIAIIGKLVLEPEQASANWNVLTALRGPDFLDAADFTKLATTSVIRYHVLRTMSDPWLQELWNRMADNNDWTSFNGFIVDKDKPEYVTHRLTSSPSKLTYMHFYVHAERAFEALGLKWHELNVHSLDIK